MDYVIGIGDYIIVNQEQGRIITHALASCVAVTFYCPEKKVAAMIHIALPICDDRNPVKSKPGYYANTGLPIVFSALQNQYRCQLSKMEVQLFGGASSIRMNDAFRIGEKNLVYIKQILRQEGVVFSEKEVGGYVSRTIKMAIETGTSEVTRQKIVV